MAFTKLTGLALCAASASAFTIPPLSASIPEYYGVDPCAEGHCPGPVTLEEGRRLDDVIVVPVTVPEYYGVDPCADGHCGPGSITPDEGRAFDPHRIRGFGGRRLAHTITPGEVSSASRRLSSQFPEFGGRRLGAGRCCCNKLCTFVNEGCC